MAETAANPQGVVRQGNLIIPPKNKSDTELVRRSRSKVPSSKPAGWVAYIALVLLTVISYSPIFLSSLAWSEYDQVERSPYQSMDAWTEAWALEMIRTEDPITLSSYFIEQKIPFEPSVIQHAINLFLHITAAILLLKNLEALKLSAAFPVALIFALHPTALQTIFWSGYREEIIGLILILTALYFGIQNRNKRDFFMHAMFCVIAYISHPASLVIPLLLGLCIFYKSGSSRFKDYNRLLPLLCLALFIGVWTQGGSTTLELEFGERLRISAQNFFFYLKQALFPFEKALFYPFHQSKGSSFGVQDSFLLILILIPFYILIAMNLRKTWARGLLLGLTAYLLLIFYGISHVGIFIDGSFALEDHLQYVALPIIIALFICTLDSITRTVGLRGIILSRVVLSIFAAIQMFMTASYAYSLSDRAQMWYNLSEQWPNAWLPKYALIDIIEKSGKESDLLTNNETINMLENILDQQPERIELREKLIDIYRKEGQNSNALRQYKRILRNSEPNNEFLLEAAEFYDRQGLFWDAKNARERIIQ